MIYTIQFIKKAREMRLSGASLSEISKEIGISRSTLSSWLKDIRLTKAQQGDIVERNRGRVSRGRLNSLIVRKSKRIHKENSIYSEAEKEIVEYSKDPFFNYGLALYLLGGAKNGNAFQFTSSNSQTIKIMIRWMHKYLVIDESLIKHRRYGKQMRIEISRVDVLRRVLSWQKLIIKYYDNL